jgi:hypothetical protein
MYLNDAKQDKDYKTHEENGTQVAKVVTLTSSPICICCE